jgi:hypothetical protein
LKTFIAKTYPVRAGRIAVVHRLAGGKVSVDLDGETKAQINYGIPEPDVVGDGPYDLPNEAAAAPGDYLLFHANNSLQVVDAETFAARYEETKENPTPATARRK